MAQIAFMGVFFVLFAVLAAYGVRQANAARAAWQQFAQENGLTLTGTYPMVAFHGAWRDVHVRCVTHVHRGHKGHRHYRHELSVQIAADVGDLSLSREGMLDKLGKVFGGQDIQVGESTFDSTFLVRGSSESRVRELLGPTVRQALIDATQRYGSLHVAGGAVHISHPGMAVVGAVLPQLEVMAEVARAFAAAQPAARGISAGGYGGNPYA